MSNLGGKNVSEDTDKDLGVDGIVAGTNIDNIDSTDPRNPIINASAQAGGQVTTKGDLEGFSTVAARIPVGTDTQVLTADSGEALGLKWATPAAGGGDVATDTIWDAKGDLAGGTGSDTAARLAVGTNDQVLTADSAEATGMKWTTPSGGAAAFHGALVERTTSLGRTATQIDAAVFVTEVYDTDGFVDLGADDDRITIPANVTKVQATVHLFCSGCSGQKRIDVVHRASGGGFIQRYSTNASSSVTDVFGSITTPVIPVSTGDFFTLASVSTDTSWTQLYVALGVEYKDGTL